jgi:hypothetical protein
MTATTPLVSYEAAISVVDHDSRTLARLQERLGARLRSAQRVRPFWTRAERERGDERSASEVFGGAARVVVVLHERMWGRTLTTRDDATAILQRVANEGIEFLHVVDLDLTPRPIWMADASGGSLLDDDLDGCVERIILAISRLGGLTRMASPADVAARAAGEEQATAARDTFLGSHRAVSAFAREFELLGDEIERHADALPALAEKPAAEVRRAPRRLTVQLGPVALSVSWIRSHFDSVADGRLLIIEWAGIVGGRQEPGAAARATALREDVLRADASKPEDWQWRSDDPGVRAYSTRELAALCVNSLTDALQGESR